MLCNDNGYLSACRGNRLGNKLEEISTVLYTITRYSSWVKKYTRCHCYWLIIDHIKFKSQSFSNECNYKNYQVDLYQHVAMRFQNNDDFPTYLENNGLQWIFLWSFYYIWYIHESTILQTAINVYKKQRFWVIHSRIFIVISDLLKFYDVIFRKFSTDVLIRIRWLRPTFQEGFYEKFGCETYWDYEFMPTMRHDGSKQDESHSLSSRIRCIQISGTSHQNHDILTFMFSVKSSNAFAPYQKEFQLSAYIV